MKFNTISSDDFKINIHLICKDPQLAVSFISMDNCYLLNIILKECSKNEILSIHQKLYENSLLIPKEYKYQYIHMTYFLKYALLKYSIKSNLMEYFLKPAIIEKYINTYGIEALDNYIN